MVRLSDSTYRSDLAIRLSGYGYSYGRSKD